ncbi:MAG: restriction endonuclease subunit S [Planctomycetota bacterium]
MSAKEWAPKVPLSEVVRHRKEFIEIDDFASYKRCRVQLHARGILLRDEVEGAAIKTKKQQVCRPDEFLVAEIDAKMGGFGIVPKELEGAIVSSHYFLFDPIREKLDPRFLGYYCRTHAFRDQVTARGTTNYAAIRPAHVLDYTIPLPPIAEQRRIVAKIESLAGKIAEARELVAETDRKASVFPTSLHAKLSRARVRRLHELIVLDEDRVSVEPNDDYPQIGIRGFGGGLFRKSATRGSETSYKHFNRIRDSQLVLSQVKGWEGAIAVASEDEADWFASPEYRTFTCLKDECDPRYLDRIVRTSWFRSKLQDATRGQGARRERTRPEMLLDIEIPFPEIGLQKKAVCWLEGVQEIADDHANTLRILEAMMPSILDRAFSGQLMDSNLESPANKGTADQQLAKRAMVYSAMLLRHWDKPVARNVFDACLALMLNDQARKKIIGNSSIQIATTNDNSGTPLRGLDSLLGGMRVLQSVEITKQSGQQFLSLGEKAPVTDHAPAADKKRLKETLAAFEIVGEDRAADVLSEMIDTPYELATT